MKEYNTRLSYPLPYSGTQDKLYSVKDFQDSNLREDDFSFASLSAKEKSGMILEGRVFEFLEPGTQICFMKITFTIGTYIDYSENYVDYYVGDVEVSANSSDKNRTLTEIEAIVSLLDTLVIKFYDCFED